MPTTPLTKRPNYWVIDKDLITAQNEPGHAWGLMGPRGCPLSHEPLTLRFRLLDDDGIVYYEGRMVPFADHDDDSDGFEPLDNYGGPNAGCTELQYLDGTWKTL